eukprot:maker-scaffold_14-snap-gene-6.52-mRNA-1 protein AED:0.30 eAED:0.30 QI:0/1/0.5/1/1/1/2/54/898
MSPTKLILSLIISLLCIHRINALYADQVGQKDWTKRFIGVPDSLLESKTPNSNTLFSFSLVTKSLSAIDSNTGELLWRKILRTNKPLKTNYVGKYFNFITQKETKFLSPTDANIFLVFFEPKELVFDSPVDPTMGTMFLSSWSESGGILGWEAQIVLNDDEDLIDFTHVQTKATLKQLNTKNILLLLTSKRLIIVDSLNGKFKKQITLTDKVKGVNSMSVETTDKTSLVHVFAATGEAIISLNEFEKNVIELSTEKKNYKRALTQVQAAEGEGYIFLENTFSQSAGKTLSRYNYMPGTDLGTIAVNFAHFDEKTSSFTMKTKENILNYKSIDSLNFVAPLTSIFKLSTKKVGFGFEDESFCVLSLDTKKKSFEVEFCREESLAAIVTKPLDFEVRHFEHDSSLNELNALDFQNRMQDQLSILTETLFALIQTATSWHQNLNFEIVTNLISSEVQARTYDLNTKMSFGLVKVIVVGTSSGKVFGLNSDSGELLYSIYIGRPKQLLLAKVIETGTHPSFVLVTDSKISTYSALSGKLLNKINFPHSDKLLVVNHTLIGSCEPFTEYNSIALSSDASAVNGMFLTLDGPKLVARKLLPGGKLGIAFSLSAPETFLISTVIHHEGERISTKGKKSGGGSVMVKYDSLNLVAVISTSEDRMETLVQLVDLFTGEVIESFLEESCDSAIEGVIFENIFLYSCFNELEARTEFNSVAVFDSKVLDKYDLNLFKAYDAKNAERFVLQKSFYLYEKVSDISITKTLWGISQKRILVGLQTGEIVAFDYRLFDPRRGEAVKAEKDKSVALPPYSPKVIKMSQAVVNYYERVEGLAQVAAFPTKLESTAIVFASGYDLHCARFQPSAGFDLLPEEFNSPLLIGMSLGLTVAVFFLRRAFQQRKLNDAWQ